MSSHKAKKKPQTSKHEYPVCERCSLWDPYYRGNGLCRLQPPFARVKKDDWCSNYQVGQKERK